MPATKNRMGYMRHTLDPLYSLYVRIREAGHNGVVSCCTCGCLGHYTEFDCGHFHIRKNYGTRYEDKNTGVQCTKCNRYGEGESAFFAKYLIGKYGSNVLNELIEKARINHLPELERMKEMAKFYRSEIRRMCKEKGIKCPI